MDEKLSDLLRPIKHVFLLVGGNLIPNAVMAKLFACCETKPKVHLVSITSAELTRVLREWLTDNHIEFETPDIQYLKEWGFAEFAGALKEHVHNAANDEPIHLHYTCSKQYVAIHTIRALEQLREEEKQNRKGKSCAEQCGNALRSRSFSFSYLDAMSDKLVWESYDEQNNYLKSESYPVEPGLSPEDLLRLSALRKYGRKARRAAFEKQCKAIHQVAWKERRRESVDGIISQLKLQERSDFDPIAAFMDISLLQQPGSPSSGAQKPTDDQITNWYCNGWLEDHCAHLIASLELTTPTQTPPHVFVGFQLFDNNDHSRQQKGRGFCEIDVVAFRDYRSYFLSCSLDKDVAYEKLTEVVVRARQIGGDYARVGVVLREGEPSELEQFAHLLLPPTVGACVFVNDEQTICDGAKLKQELQEWVDPIHGGTLPASGSASSQAGATQANVTSLQYITVGTNPLPVALAVRQCDRAKDGCVLVATAQTTKVATEVLKSLDRQDCVPLVVNASDPDSIYQQINEHLKGYKSCNLVTVHYTGGTKLMARHVIRAVDDWAAEKSVSATLCYLDSDTGEMITVGSPPSNRGQVGAAGQSGNFVPTARQVAQMHGIVLNEQDRDVPLSQTVINQHLNAGLTWQSCKFQSVVDLQFRHWSLPDQVGTINKREWISKDGPVKVEVESCHLAVGEKGQGVQCVVVWQAKFESTPKGKRAELQTGCRQVFKSMILELWCRTRQMAGDEARMLFLLPPEVGSLVTAQNLHTQLQQNLGWPVTADQPPRQLRVLKVSKRAEEEITTWLSGGAN